METANCDDEVMQNAAADQFPPFSQFLSRFLLFPSPPTGRDFPESRYVSRREFEDISARESLPIL